LVQGARELSIRFRFPQLALGALGVLIAVAVLGLWKSPTAERQAGGASQPAAASAELDPVAALQQKIDRREVALAFDREHGYLKSVLDQLHIPVSSQMLVFSKSSAQMSGISPERPRALYFNDDAYVGWVQEGGLELAAVSPKDGPYFYTLTQESSEAPRFERHTDTCVGCHDSSDDPARLIPRLLKLSVLPDADGASIQAAALATTDRSPFRERWGGWYVTGTHGRQVHMGNQTFNRPATEFASLPDYIARLDLTRGSNVTDLSGRFDTKRYLSPHSDIVALMVLGHQTHVYNLIAAAEYQMRYALEDDPRADQAALLKQGGEPIVRAMLFSGEAKLTDTVAGTSGYAEEFARQGPRDREGRSLRDLDLKTRLLRYPMSYVIYSQAFDQMPEALKTFVLRRFREVLSGEDQSPAFAHLSPADREQIRSILRETKPSVLVP
jgi:hypothetical protein